MSVCRMMLRLGGYMLFAIALAHLAMFALIQQIGGRLGMPPWLGRMLAEGWVGWGKLFLMIGGVAAVVTLLGLYGLSGAGRIRRLPLLRTGLLGTGTLFLLHGLFDNGFGLVFRLGDLARLAAEGNPRAFLALVPLTTLTVGLCYLSGTIGLWSALAPAKDGRESAGVAAALLTSLLLVSASAAQAAEATASATGPIAVPFDSGRWQLDEGTEIVSFGGRTALAGTAFVRDVALLNGTVEADVWTTGEPRFGGIAFRVQSFDELEWLWLRLAKTNGRNPDAVQYAPIVRRVFCWQLHPAENAPVSLPKNEWVHLKLEFRGRSAAFFASDMAKPVMVVDRLDLEPKPGSIGLRMTASGGVYFSNFTYTPDDTSTAKPLPQDPPLPANVIANWQLSRASYPVPDFEAISAYPARQLADRVEWIVPLVEPSGLVNISRFHGTPHHGRGAALPGPKPDCALLRARIEARVDKRVRLSFGYSDAVAIFLNGEQLFWGNSAFLSRNTSFAGWISFGDAVFLNLRKGSNDLVVAVAEDFGGWGFQAKLDDVEGLGFPSPSRRQAGAR